MSEQDRAAAPPLPPRLAAALVFLVALAAFSFQLGRAPLAGTEGHRAITAHQMVESSQYMVPTLYGYTYLKKPPLDYWILAGFEKVLGPGEFTWRFPSVLAAAALAALIVITSARWFDATAGLVAGFSYVGLVALWSQTRSADIDSLNTLASVATALFLLDLGVMRRRSLRTAVLAALAFAAAWLLKGPACLPVVLGALAGPAILNRTIRPVSNWRSWVALVAGLGVFAAWSVLAKGVVASRGMVPDTGGQEEALRRMLLTQWRQVLPALALAPTVLAYALPISLCLLLPFHRRLGKLIDAEHRAIARGLVGTVLAALVICFISGMDNPRYAYPILPLLCPLAGLLGSIWHRGRIIELDAARLRGGMIALAIGYAVGAVVLLRIGPGAAPVTVTVGAGVIAGTAALWTAVNWYRNRTMRGAWGLAGLVVLLCLAFGSLWTRQRTARSAYAAAQQVRAITGGAGSPIMTWYMLWAQPELFYYADVQAVPVRFGKEPPPLTEGWILLYRGSEIDEMAAWPQPAGSAGRGAALTRPTTLRVNKAQAVLAWYTAAPRAASQSTSGPSRGAP